MGAMPLRFGFMPPGVSRGGLQFEATLWWFAVAFVCSALVRLAFALTLQLIPGKRRAAYAFFGDTFALAFFVIAVVAVASFVYELPVSTVFATSSIIGVVLGFALQNTLSDVLSGIALALEQPFRIGDWVTIDDKYSGRVIELTWRTTRLQPKASDLIVLPNAFVSRAKLVNHYLPTMPHRETADVQLCVYEPPQHVCDVLQAAAMAADGVLPHPPPSVDIVDLGDTAMTYRVKFYLEDFDKRGDVLTAVYKQLWAHMTWAGFDKPTPRSVVALERRPPPADERTQLIELVTRIPVFASLTGDERERLVDALKPRLVHAGEVLLRQFEAGSSLFIVRSGLLDVSVATEDGERNVGRLGPGDYLGEASLLTGCTRNATVTATTDAQTFELDKGDLMPIVQERPEVLNAFARVLAQREQTHHFAAVSASTNGGFAHFAGQIKAFFQRL